MDLQEHTEKNEGPERTAKTLGQGEQPRSGGRDYLALGVLVLLLGALVITGYLSFRAIAKGDEFRSDRSVGEWIQGLEDRAREWLGQRVRIGKGKRDSAEGHLARGYNHYRKKRYARALEELDRAIRMNEANPEAYYWRGRTLINQGRFEPAVKDFQKAVHLKPDYPEAYDNLGWLFDRLGKTDQAVDALSKSIELKSDNGWAYYQRGRMLFKLGDRNGAVRDAEKACALRFQEGCALYEKLKSGGEDSS